MRVHTGCMVRDEMMTRREVAEALQISESMVRKLDQQGLLHPEKDAHGRVQYRAPEVQAVRAHRAPGTAVRTPDVPPSFASSIGSDHDAIGRPSPPDDEPVPAVAAALASDPEVLAAWRRTELARAREAEARADRAAKEHREDAEAERAAAARRERRTRVEMIATRYASAYVGEERGVVASAVRGALRCVDVRLLDNAAWVDARVRDHIAHAIAAHRAEQAVAEQQALRQRIVQEVGARLRALGYPGPLAQHAVVAVHDDLATIRVDTMCPEPWLRQRAWCVASRAIEMVLVQWAGYGRLVVGP